MIPVRREEIRAWLRANVPAEASVAWEKALYDAGLAVLTWPAQYGGRDASVRDWLVFEEEYWLAGGPPRLTQNGISLLAPALFELGTEEQKDRILRPMAAAEVLWAQGWSEPGAGSDLAAVRSTAVRTDGGWLLSGQKTWSTRATLCHAMHGLFRTDPSAARHKGLTYFLVPLDAPGVRVDGFRRLDGDLDFAEVFLDEVFVPDRDVVGEVNQGWMVAMATTGSERGATLRSPGRYLATAARLVSLYKQRPDPGVRDAVVKAWIDAQAYERYTMQSVERLEAGTAIAASSSINKIAWSELDIALHEAALALLGPEAELEGPWIKGYQFALAGPIYAGTNEIQRNVIAERLLGLPKE
jgi:alkylation response protein AidB-like acyl-CoA dehydrogenase